MTLRDPSLHSPPVAAWRPLLHVVRRVAVLVGIGALAGLVAGFLAGGVGSRLAMRAVALLAGHEHYGELTDAREAVGETSLGGTLFLLIFSSFLGLFGGLLYVIVRAWLPGRGLAKGLAYGVLVLSLTGNRIVDPANSDFRRFVPSVVSVTLFALLPVLFGVIVAALVDRLDRRASGYPLPRWLELGGSILLAVAALAGLTRNAQALAAIF